MYEKITQNIYVLKEAKKQIGVKIRNCLRYIFIIYSVLLFLTLWLKNTYNLGIVSLIILFCIISIITIFITCVPQIDTDIIPELDKFTIWNFLSLNIFAIKCFIPLVVLNKNINKVLEPKTDKQIMEGIVELVNLSSSAIHSEVIRCYNNRVFDFLTYVGFNCKYDKYNKTCYIEPNDRLYEKLYMDIKSIRKGRV